ncbi:kinase-like domain-containing protein [Peziza echinospora]|nr:kinase-like domain-containing protein [Peziza echinospora]
MNIDKTRLLTIGILVNTYARKTHIGPWQLGKTLGTGSTGRIRLVRHESSGQRGAAKIMTKEYNLETYLENGRELAQERWTNAMEREVIIMKMIRHPHVVQMYDVWETKRELYLVLEYVEGGDLFEYIIKHQQVAEAEAVRLFVQLMSGVDYCHSFSICHRDLKPENILLDKFNNVKIADFGFAALQPPGWKLARSCGTPHYAAPEVIAGVQYDGAPADIWSCGVILFALLAGRVPFDDEDARVLLQKVRFGAFDMPEELSPEAKDLISRMLTVEPTSRITMAEIWTHPLFSNYLSPAKLEEARLPHGYSNVGRPLANANEIDPVILESLRSLWHGQSAAVVTEALMNEE